MMKAEPEEYEFTKRINRISLEVQVPPLFDNTPERAGSRASYYSGTISEIPTIVRFRTGESCRLSPRTQEELDEAHKEALKRL